MWMLQSCSWDRSSLVIQVRVCALGLLYFLRDVVVFQFHGICLLTLDDIHNDDSDANPAARRSRSAFLLNPALCSCSSPCPTSQGFHPKDSRKKLPTPDSPSSGPRYDYSMTMAMGCELSVNPS